MEIPFLAWQQFGNPIGSVIPLIVNEQNRQPIINSIRPSRDEAAYDFRDGFGKKKFKRRWAHSRTGTETMLSLEQLMEGAPESTNSENDSFEAGIIERQSFPA